MDFSFFKNFFSSSHSDKKENDGSQAKESDNGNADVVTAENPVPAPENANEESEPSQERHPRHRRNRRPRRPMDDSARHADNEGEETESSLAPADEEAALQKLQAFVLFLARNLVTEPEKVSTTIAHKDASAVVMVSCAKKDTGKIIGKNGKIISAIRLLVAGTATRMGVKASVDIVD